MIDRTWLLQAGQKVWFIDHHQNKLREGILVSTDNQSEFDEHPTLSIDEERDGMKWPQRVLADWVFTSEGNGKIGLKRKINQDIRRKQEEIKQLRHCIQLLKMMKEDYNEI